MPKVRPDVPADDFLSIDMNRLDWEWSNQPKLYFQWSKDLADAREDLERAKAIKDIREAEIAQDVRERPEAYNVDKVTEKSVAEAVAVLLPHQAETKDMYAAKHRVDIVQAAVTALDHRKKALENLVYLYGASYFSTPVDTSAGKATQERVKARGRVRGHQQRELEE